MKMVTVVATAIGFDGVTARQPGDEFRVPASMFDKRPRLDAKGQPDGTFYDPPSWFKLKDAKELAAPAAPESESESESEGAEDLA